MSRIVCLAVVISALAAPAFAGMNEGVAAVTVGDYPRAIAEFEPLAESGDAAAQYHLAKIYLEGHGPANGVPRGVELMTQAANGNYPEAQAQLGLMYAMGLGVQVDNPKAYDWLNKAVVALPDGTRRTVAESNRDAVLKRMTDQERSAIAGLPAASSDAAAGANAASTTPAEPTMAEPPAAEPAVAAAAPAKPAPVEPTPEATPTKSAAVETKPAKPAETVEPAPAPAPLVTKSAEPLPAPPPPDPEPTEVASAPETAAPEKPAAEPTQETPAVPQKVASAEPAVTAIGSASAQDVQSSVRIQLASLPTEEGAWAQWKRLSAKFATELTGLTAIVQPTDLGTKGTFYRLQTGPFEDAAAAKERCATMKQAGLDCLVIGAP